MRKGLYGRFTSGVLGCFLAAATVFAQGAPQPLKKNPVAAKKPAAAQMPSVPELDPKAVEILQATSRRLAAAGTLSFNAVEMFESPSRRGFPVSYAVRTEVALQRPDKLRVNITGDGPASEFYYDGKKMTAYAPVENLVAVADAPPTIDEALEAAHKAAAMYFPFTDLIVADPYKDMSPGMRIAHYIGQSHIVGGTTTDIIGYVTDGVAVQMWVGAEDRLPRMIRALYLDDPTEMRHQLELTDWQLDAVLPEGTFTASKAANAKRMAFAHPNPPAPPGAPPPAKPKATTAKTK